MRSSAASPKASPAPCAIEGEPVRQPRAAEAQRLRPRPAGSCRPRRPRAPAPIPGSSHAACAARETTAIDHRRMASSRLALERDLVGIGLAGCFALKTPVRRSPPPSPWPRPENTMKRQGASLPWSGTRAATVRSLVGAGSSSGPGSGQRNCGGTERRSLSRESVSVMKRSGRWRRRAGNRRGRRSQSELVLRHDEDKRSLLRPRRRGADGRSACFNCERVPGFDRRCPQSQRARLWSCSSPR
jgi:hypothetical protein